jgi:hypothetical protein
LSIKLSGYGYPISGQTIRIRKDPLGECGYGNGILTVPDAIAKTRIGRHIEINQTLIDWLEWHRRNEGKLCLELGHSSQKMLHRHYARSMRRKDAEAIFEIRPMRRRG